MTKSLNRFISGVIIFWIAVFIFQKEILVFLGGWGPSWIKDILLRVVEFMVSWGNQAWNLVKLSLKWLVEATGRIVSGADPLYGLVKWLGNILSGIIKWIIDLFSPIFGKFFIK